jgi:hypothetical protein
METKKKLILRLGLGCLVALVLSLAALGLAALREHAYRRSQEQERQSQREATVERSRKFLAEIARRITTLPVDATVLGEIESRYFEEYPRGRMHVWAMGPSGEFLFGVPREAFDKLNGIYDRDVRPLLEDGIFVDRQTFLRRLVDESEDIDEKAFAGTGAKVEEGEGEPAREPAERAWERWGRRGDESDRSSVLSTPLKTADGQALGNLYVKTTFAPQSYERDEADAALANAAGVGAVASLCALWMLLPTWVFVDARGRGVRRAALFAFLTVLSAVVGLVVYLIARPEDPRTLSCPGCGREVDGGAFCPHCGRDLSAAFCAACRYPLKPDWVYCPACRAEIKPQPPAPAGTAEVAG